jgi:hypothetical protein
MTYYGTVPDLVPVVVLVPVPVLVLVGQLSNSTILYY